MIICGIVTIWTCPVIFSRVLLRPTAVEIPLMIFVYTFSSVCVTFNYWFWGRLGFLLSVKSVYIPWVSWLHFHETCSTVYKSKSVSHEIQEFWNYSLDDHTKTCRTDMCTEAIPINARGKDSQSNKETGIRWLSHEWASFVPSQFRVYIPALSFPSLEMNPRIYTSSGIRIPVLE